MINGCLLTNVKRMVFCFLAVIGQSTYAAQDFEQALVDYVVAIEGVKKLQADRTCGYVIKKAGFPSPPYRELTTRLSHESRRSFESFLTSPQWTKQINRIGLSEAELATSFAPQLDSNTKCGLWAGFAVATLNNAKQAFRHIGTAQAPEQPPLSALQREYVINDDGILDAELRIIFSRCLLGQSLRKGICMGKAEKVSTSEAFDPRTEARLKPWRVPTAAELNPLLRYYITRNDFPIPQGTHLLTSTPATVGHRVIGFASFREVQSNKLGSMQVSSDLVPQSYLLLVRSAP